MSVLVTGGAGYIGSHTVWELCDAGHDVVVVDRLSTGFDWAVAPEAELVVGDIGDRALIETVIRKHKVDSIIHFAGSIVVPDSVSDPLGYYENNTCKSRTLIDAAIGLGVRNFIFSSTAAVYGAAGLEPVGEAAALTPQSPYGRSKLMTEWMMQDAAAAFSDFRYTALRYFNVAGADPKGRTGQSTKGATHLIKVACETALGKRQALEIYGTDYPTPDGTCVRDYIHVSDLAAAHRLALERLRDGGSSLVANCGYGYGYSVRQVLDSVRRVHGGELNVREAGRRAGDPPSIVADSRLAQRELGWVPARADLDLIVGDALRWEDALTRRNSK